MRERRILDVEGYEGLSYNQGYGRGQRQLSTSFSTREGQAKTKRTFFIVVGRVIVGQSCLQP